MSRVSVSVAPSSLLRCAAQISSRYVLKLESGQSCDFLMNGWRGFPVASCVNRHPWFLRGGFAVVLRVSLGRAVMAWWFCSCAVVAPGLFCGRPASALFLFGGSAVAGWSVFLCGRSLLFFLWLLGSVIVTGLLCVCSLVALCSEVAPKLFRGLFEEGLSLF